MLAAPVSYCAFRLGALFFAKANSETAIASTGAFFAQFALNSTSAPRDFSKFSGSSLVATMYAHGCSLLLEGAQRAASKRLRKSSDETGLSLNARGLHRFLIKSWTAYSTGAGLFIIDPQKSKPRYFAACLTISRSIMIVTVSPTTTPPPSMFAFHFTPKSWRFTFVVALAAARVFPQGSFTGAVGPSHQALLPS